MNCASDLLITLRFSLVFFQQQEAGLNMCTTRGSFTGGRPASVHASVFLKSSQNSTGSRQAVVGTGVLYASY